ncbi:MAG: tRNA (guanosine(46)-N7)-methyltransferase TrmB [Planctomycetia bacterium]|nr:tRNA (guanosine(46)-N7)-methyltransferase TrmB [Planctomycetia bacterium]
MGRRALRKIDPAIQYAAWLLGPEQLPRPWNDSAVFPAAGPLEMELGTGKGLFLAQAAQAHPDRNYLGIEVSRKYAHYAAARLARLELVNARVVHGEGMRIFHEVLPSDGLAAVHVYFPDPWWKARHKKRRVMNEAFLRDVERTLAAGGSLHFWTDVEEYFDATVQLVAAATKLAGPVAVAEKPPEHDLDYRTHFERRTRLHGDRVYRAVFRKRS